jgi:hypothetical protein
MAGHRVTAPAIEAYLAEGARRLHGPRRQRQQILAELGDGLHQATDHHVAAGQPDDVAVTKAIAEFGTPQHLAAAFAGELATAYARRTIAWFIATGPLVGVWWLLLLHPAPWRTGAFALVAAIPVIPLIVLAIATAAGTLATTGRLMRWLPETGAQHALTATLAVAALALAGDVVIITLFARSAMPVRALAVLALACSLTRIACSLLTIRHATAMRRELSRRHVSAAAGGHHA